MGGGQLAHYVDTPHAPTHYNFRLLGWQPASWDDGKTYYSPSYESDNPSTSLVTYEVPDGVRVLRAAVVTTFEPTSLTGFGPAQESLTELTASGATSWTWDGTPVNATSFSGRVQFTETADCLTIPNRNTSLGCPYPDSRQSGRYTYSLRLLIDDATPDLPTPTLTQTDPPPA